MLGPSVGEQVRLPLPQGPLRRTLRFLHFLKTNVSFLRFDKGINSIKKHTHTHTQKNTHTHTKEKKTQNRRSRGGSKGWPPCGLGAPGLVWAKVSKQLKRKPNGAKGPPASWPTGSRMETKAWLEGNQAVEPKSLAEWNKSGKLGELVYGHVFSIIRLRYQQLDVFFPGHPLIPC